MIVPGTRVTVTPPLLLTADDWLVLLKYAERDRWFLLDIFRSILVIVTWRIRLDAALEILYRVLFKLSSLFECKFGIRFTRITFTVEGRLIESSPRLSLSCDLLSLICWMLVMLAISDCDTFLTETVGEFWCSPESVNSMAESDRLMCWSLFSTVVLPKDSLCDELNRFSLLKDRLLCIRFLI